MSSNLSPVGSSTYSSNTLHVGDGTWDDGRDDFLLPPLVGLDFATMRYNGMGNRFAALPEYHRLIIGHGVLAAITFLAVIPAAVFVAKFYTNNPRMAVKLHVYLQIITVFLTTVIIILGWMAVGPERALTNPHHGIGIALYVLILFQFLFGWIMARIESRRRNPERLIRTPTKVWIHKLMGRSIALLGIVQIALGLTLYGSPKVLFVLYALAGALLLFLYLALDRVYFEKRQLMFGIGGGQPEFYSDYGSYLSGSRVDSRPPPPGAPPMRERRDRNHWGRDALAGVGALGAYEWWRNRQDRRRGDREQESYDADEEMRRREEREQAELDAERRARPPPGAAASTALSSRPSSRPPPGVSYGAGGVPSGPAGFGPPPPGPRTPSRVRRTEEERFSPESWEDEKYEQRPARNSWRDRLLGAGAGIGAFEGARRLFNRRRDREDDYIEDDRRYRPALGGNQNMVNQTDVSRVEAGQTPLSPNDPRRAGGERMNVAGVQPMTPTATPLRPRHGQRPSAETMSYDDEESMMDQGRQRLSTHHEGDNHTLRNSIATLGTIAGFREWNKHRRERRERQRLDRIRQQELDDETEMYNRRNSANYPTAHDAGGRRPSDGTLLTGASGPVDPGFGGSNPELSRRRFEEVDTSHPPLPASAGAVPSPMLNQQRVNEPPLQHFPPPPPGPPPGGIRPTDYHAPDPGTLQMPQGAVNPDPSRLVSTENVVQQASSSHPIHDVSAGALFGAAAADVASGRRRDSQSQSPSRYGPRQQSRTRFADQPQRQGTTASGSAPEILTDLPAASDAPGSPPVSVKVKMHGDGRHVTLRRLNEEEAAAERAARRSERRQRRRRSSEVSSGGLEDEAPPGSNARYRRNGGSSIARRRSSADQPITNVPPPPPMSSTSHVGSHRPPSELNLPSPPIAGQGLSPPGAMPAGSGMTSPGDGTGTDVSAFADNRRRRRAERARRLEAARGAGAGQSRVDFT
ncbi:hypothetical protein BAUCODRAFT_35888 [Baudoinia panamericana UAMH 10762]|uniref:Cytochrome b561 domain-containing protein n=1 Tax=Baudoinia panamericana (strain UAMH 10762) TaxID=717646 RepID=M2N6H5_BAUPA|nr:uncharacterized protein BAUCODRAFT_35888 [Baudoinia panamericana UAMH 10762]EMC94654.1 hypothetical protein BAUCODRAFT_35888 [Baudoinia panamericana UAMH 10762]